MKRITLYILLLLAGVQCAMAQIVEEGQAVHQDADGTYYVLWDLDNEYYVINGIPPTKEISYNSARGKQVYFDAKRANNGQGYLTLEQGIDKKNYTNVTSILKPGQMEKYWEEEEQCSGILWNKKCSTVVVEKERLAFKTYGPYPIDRASNTLRFATSADGIWNALNRYFKNIKVTMAEYIAATETSLTFKDDLGYDYYVVTKDQDSSIIRTFTFDWCNAGDIQVALKSNTPEAAKQYTVTCKDENGNDIFKINGDTAAVLFNSNGRWGKVTLEVAYARSSWGNHPATLTVTSSTAATDANTVSVELTGNTLGYEQMISWWTDDDPVILTLEDIVEQAATTSSGEKVAYTMSIGGTDYLDITPDGKITPKQPTPQGTLITLTAAQSGNYYYMPAPTITKQIEVTHKKRQTVYWEQSLLNIKLPEDPSIEQRITLEAYFIQGQDTIPATSYTCSDESVAKIDGNELIIRDKGRATITAYQEGNENYIAATATKTLMVSDNSRGCIDLVAAEYAEKNLWTDIWDFLGAYGTEIPLDGVPNKISFMGKKSGGAMGDYLNVQEYRDGAWHDIEMPNNPKLSTEWTQIGPYQLTETATKVRIYKKTGATLNHYYNNVEVTRKRFMTANIGNIAFSAIPTDSKESRFVSINYSNMPTSLTIEIQNDEGGNFSVIQKSLGIGCGATGTETIEVVYNPKAIGEHTAELVIRDPEPEKESEDNRINELRIPLTGIATNKYTVITWNQVWNDPKTVDEITFNAYATANLPVTYSQTEESKEVALVNDSTGELTILRDGYIKIFADAVGDSTYLPAKQIYREFTIRKTKYEETDVHIHLEELGKGQKLADAIYTLDVIDEAGKTVAGNISWENPDSILMNKSEDGSKEKHTFTFTPTKNNFYEPAFVTFNNYAVPVGNPRWLPIVPPTDGTQAQPIVPIDSIYVNMLYMETDSLYTTLNDTADIIVSGSQYILLQAKADKWRTFVAPFDIQKAYVIELTPEPQANISKEETRIQMLADQKEATQKFYEYIQQVLVTKQTNKPLKELVDKYLEELCTTNGYTSQNEVGIYKLEHYNGKNIWTFTYYLYESTPTWELINDTAFVKDWRYIETDNTIMEHGKTYAINFPYCMECPDYKGWDYWTDKLILLEHIGPQTIQGAHTAKDFKEPTPKKQTAHHTGNSFLADVEIESNHAFIHNTETDLYERITAKTKIRPTTSVMYADIDAPQGKRARAIARSGEILWEDDQTSGSITTDIEHTTPLTSGITVLARPIGFALVTNRTQHIAVYHVDGSLIYSGILHADTEQTFTVEAGMYIVHTETATHKVMVR